jgi:hypothetical protein
VNEENETMKERQLWSMSAGVGMEFKNVEHWNERMVADENGTHFNDVQDYAKSYEQKEQLEREIGTMWMASKYSGREQEFARREAGTTNCKLSMPKFADDYGVSCSSGRGMSIEEMSDALPEFDPYGEASPNVEVFIRRVRTLKDHYGWDVALVRLALVPKLKGTAKIWFNGLVRPC